MIVHTSIAVGSGSRRLSDHAFGRLLQADEPRHLRIGLTFQDTAQFAHEGRREFAAFDGQHHVLEAVARLKVDTTIYAQVARMFRTREAPREFHCPVLELPRIVLKQVLCGLNAQRHAAHVVVLALNESISLEQHITYELDRQDGNIASYPFPSEQMGSIDRGAAAAERIKDDIASITACRDDALKERDGLLGRIAEAFCGHRIDWRHIVPDVLRRDARSVKQISLEARHPAVLCWPID